MPSLSHTHDKETQSFISVLQNWHYTQQTCERVHQKQGFHMHMSLLFLHAHNCVYATRGTQVKIHVPSFRTREKIGSVQRSH